jgi:hypothetical protein
VLRSGRTLFFQQSFFHRRDSENAESHGAIAVVSFHILCALCVSAVIFGTDSAALGEEIATETTGTTESRSGGIAACNLGGFSGFGG